MNYQLSEDFTLFDLICDIAASNEDESGEAGREESDLSTVIGAALSLMTEAQIEGLNFEYEPELDTIENYWHELDGIINAMTVEQRANLERQLSTIIEDLAPESFA